MVKVTTAHESVLSDITGIEAVESAALCAQIVKVIVRELMGETLPPPPPGEFRRPIFPKTLYPQLFRSACLHLYRGYICPGGPIEGRYLPHFRGGGDILWVWVVWTLAILWDTPNLLCWSSDQQVQLPNTFQKHRIPILGKNFKKRLKK